MAPVRAQRPPSSFSFSSSSTPPPPPPPPVCTRSLALSLTLASFYSNDRRSLASSLAINQLVSSLICTSSCYFATHFTSCSRLANSFFLSLSLANSFSLFLSISPHISHLAQDLRVSCVSSSLSLSHTHTHIIYIYALHHAMILGSLLLILE